MRMSCRFLAVLIVLFAVGCAGTNGGMSPREYAAPSEAPAEAGMPPAGPSVYDPPEDY